MFGERFNIDQHNFPRFMEKVVPLLVFFVGATVIAVRNTTKKTLDSQTSCSNGCLCRDVPLKNGLWWDLSQEFWDGRPTKEVNLHDLVRS